MNSPYPARGAGVLNQGQKSMPDAVLGELASPYLSAGLCADRRSEPRYGSSRVFSVFFGARKNGQKTDGQKIDFFRKSWRFWCLRRRFLAIFGLKTGSRRLLFRCFFENGDFVKIVARCPGAVFTGFWGPGRTSKMTKNRSIRSNTRPIF